MVNKRTIIENIANSEDTFYKLDFDDLNLQSKNKLLKQICKKLLELEKKLGEK